MLPANGARLSRFKPGNTSRRLIALFVVSALALVAVLVRVVLLQTVEADQLRAVGYDQRTSESVLPATRGSILDRDGTELAISVPATTVFADPRLVADPQATAAAVGALLGASPERIAKLAAQLADRTRGFVYVARQLDDGLAQAVLGLGLAGVSSYREDTRIMPSGDVGRSIIGRTDPDGRGLGGLEEQFDELLTGVPGQRIREHDTEGRSIPGSGTTTVQPQPGDDLVLTVDRSLQFQAEQSLLRRVQTLNAQGGTVVVMDTATGEIYAMANVQRDDSTGIAEVTSANLAAVAPNEPGSVAKVFSVAAAIDQGAVTPDTTFDVPGKWTFDKGSKKYERTIEDAFPHDTMPMSIRDILVKSSNIGTLLAAKQIESSTLEQYLRGFGLGEPTGLKFPDESTGQLDPSTEWSGSKRSTVSYGYGFSATSVQLVAAVNTVANGGVFVGPKLVRSVIGADGELTASDPSPTRRVLEPTTATAMVSMMTDVVCAGTATKAQLDGISVAGKTGTSRKVQPDADPTDPYVAKDGTRSYYATFVGFFPAQAPRVTILASIDQPDPSTRDRFGGTAAAPLFAEVAEAAIHELQITPTPGDTGCPKQG
jgi:cell division protein FtsI (penicillin-binding protein 3)